MNKKGLIGVQMSTIAPAKMPSFEPFEVMGRLTDLGYHCAEISQVPMTPENVAGFRKAVENNTDDYIHVKDGTTVIRLMDSIFRSANTSALVEV